MPTITLFVDAISGHYTIPGPTASGSGGLVASFPIAPPSTIRGFLAALSGLSTQDLLDLKFSYGYRKPPEGRGQLLRKAAVWASKTAPQVGETIRPLLIDTFFGMQYWITVEGDVSDRIRQVLHGDGERPKGGYLYLGESSDLVTSVRESNDKKDAGGGCMVVPGRKVVMPWISGRGYGIRNAVLKGWDLVPLSD